MRSSSHDALGQPPYSQTSDPSHSVFIMAGHCKYFIDFFYDCVAMEIRETDFSPPLRLVGCFPTWPTFPLKGAAILDLENNTIHCSPNNNPLSFSAPDWLPAL